MAYWPAKSLIILENKLKGQEMETEGYWPISYPLSPVPTVEHKMEVLLINIRSIRKQLNTLNKQAQWMENRLEELINGMESGA